jgi:7-cyano-7-deazaguanine synthase in queuosine biosynthesis
MRETLVLCGDVPPRRDRHGGQFLRLDASPAAEPRHRVGLQLEAISKVFADNVPDILADMLEVASYVYAADRLIGRGSAKLTDMGADWHRKIRLRLAVRSPARWEAPDVKAALVEALEFLSDDAWQFEFLQTERKTRIQPYLGFSDHQAQVIDPDVVMLFSGGLDSTAGLVEELLGKGSRVAFVTHRSAKLLAGRQSELVNRIRQRSPTRSLFHVPIWVTKGEQGPVEFSQRTRSLLFAVLGILVAHMFGKQEIFFFENGITSFNLPIAEHVLGTRASRTTHPRVFRALERLFSLLLKTPIKTINPYVWKTKKDIVGVLAELGCTDLIADTVSCANVRQVPMTNKHCGVCVQCVERRFAILACGLGKEDPAEGYALDLFRSEHRRVEDITMCECMR